MDKRIYIELEKGTTRVQRTLYRPFDPVYGEGKTESEMLENGYLIEEPQAPEHIPGKTYVAHYTPEKGYWYEYIDTPPQPGNPETEIAALKAQVEATQEALDFILMGQGV